MSGLAPPSTDARVVRVVEFFETLTPQSLKRIDGIYAPQAYFKDPFNEVRGCDAVRPIFEHMFVALLEPRFHVTRALAQGDECFLAWDFRFRFRRFSTEEQCIRGASHIAFDRDGRISLHRDYWDAAEELYEKLPAVGALMRWLRRRARS